MFKHLFPVMFETPEGGTGGTPPEPTPAPEAAPQPAPWTADLEQYITDPQARVEADRYLREKVQPRMTQLEDSPAAKLYRDLTDDSKQDVTIAAIVGHVYGDEIADKFVSLFGEEGEHLPEGASAEEGVAAAAGAVAEESGQQPPEDPNAAWVAQKRAEEEAEAQQAEYDAFMDRVVGDEGNAEWRVLLDDPEFTLTAEDKDLLSPFVSSSETMGEAIQKYAAHLKALAARGQASTPAAAEAGAAEAAAPPTLASAGAAATTPPIEKKYTWDTIGDAVADYQAEQRSKAAAAPPTL
jgi:hypothetical protein